MFVSNVLLMPCQGEQVEADPTGARLPDSYGNANLSAYGVSS
jgi:hypothetical protein